MESKPLLAVLGFILGTFVVGWIHSLARKDVVYFGVSDRTTQYLLLTNHAKCTLFQRIFLTVLIKQIKRNRIWTWGTWLLNSISMVGYVLYCLALVVLALLPDVPMTAVGYLAKGPIAWGVVFLVFTFIPELRFNPERRSRYSLEPFKTWDW